MGENLARLAFVFETVQAFVNGVEACDYFIKTSFQDHDYATHKAYNDK